MAVDPDAAVIRISVGSGLDREYRNDEKARSGRTGMRELTQLRRVGGVILAVDFVGAQHCFELLPDAWLGD